jgi:hypothetical protein
MGVAVWLGLSRHGSQAMEDSASLYGLLALASLAQSRKLLFELREFTDTFVYMGPVRVRHGIDRTTAFTRLIHRHQQCVNFFMTHVKGSAISDKAQALQMLRPIDPEIA